MSAAAPGAVVVLPESPVADKPTGIDGFIHLVVRLGVTQASVVVVSRRWGGAFQYQVVRRVLRKVASGAAVAATPGYFVVAGGSLLPQVLDHGVGQVLPVAGRRERQPAVEKPTLTISVLHAESLYAVNVCGVEDARLDRLTT